MTVTPVPPQPPRGMVWLGILAAVSLSAADEPGQGVPSDPMFRALKVDGTSVTGRLRGIDAAGSVMLAVDDKERIETLPRGVLVKLTREGSTPPPSAEGGRTVLIFPDGDRLSRCVIASAGEATLEVQRPERGPLAIPIDGILGLIFNAPLEPDAADVLISRVRDEPRSSEVLWLANGDRLAGGLLGLDDKKVTFQTPNRKADYEASGLVALGFDPKLVVYPRPEGPFLELTLVDGSRLGVTDVRVEGGMVRAKTRHGLAISLPVGELTQVHTKNGPVVYLSDIEPARTKYIPYVGPPRPFKKDQAVDGLPLRLGGKVYDRGIGTQSRSYLAYRLDPDVKRLQALVGLDDRAGPLGSVVFRVVVDGEDRYVSPTMSARDAPRALDVDIKGAKTLVLVTDFADRGDVRDHADWVEVRLIR
jgi:NPCBM/NEW2 domain